jgi:hypothetical protein
MELALRNELDIKLGDIIYYINTGVVKSHDLKTTKNKETGVSTVTLNCKLIEPNVVEGFEKKELDVLKKALTRVLEDGDDSYEFVQARIDTINDELFMNITLLVI